MLLSYLPFLVGASRPKEVKKPELDKKTEGEGAGVVSPKAVETITSLKTHADQGGIEIFPEGLRLCIRILIDEAKFNPDGLDAVAAALNFKISTLLLCLGRCLDEKCL